MSQAVWPEMMVRGNPPGLVRARAVQNSADLGVLESS